MANGNQLGHFGRNVGVVGARARGARAFDRTTPHQAALQPADRTPSSGRSSPTTTIANATMKPTGGWPATRAMRMPTAAALRQC